MRRLQDFGDLSPAETRLRDAIGRDDNPEGEVVIGADRPGETAGPERQVRGAFLRYLMLGGCEALPAPVPERGVRVRGALITGTLNLEGARCPRDLALFNCRFDSAPVLLSAEIDGVYLNRSAIPGLVADRLALRGGLFLRGVESTGTLRLLGARLGWDLDCSGAVLTGGAEELTLVADGLETRGSVLLNGGFRSDGTVRLLNARLGGILDCDGPVLTGGAASVVLHADRLEARGGVFLRGGFRSEGTVRLLGAQLGGDLDCTAALLAAKDGKSALIADGADIAGSFFLRKGARMMGALDLTAARFGDFNDARECWPGHGDLLLDRCRYGAFTGHAPVNAAARIDWLSRQDPARWGRDFLPQPWEQCAKVLREMGHVEAARAVLIDKERRQREARRAKANWYAWLYWWVLDWLMAVTTRYGRRPTLAFLWLLGFWLFGTAVFYGAERAEAIKPNNAFVLRSAEWSACAPDYVQEAGMPAVRWRSNHASQLACFHAQPEAQSFPKFNALVYSADTLLPIVAMEMQEFWIPDGGLARVYLWVHIVVGWALSLLAVAGFSGLIKTD